ncbi:CsbD family protein [Thalassobacillus devorans]|uniref:CsbD family protein n=1 Tax=Thalassobacillus devorans TaxID=279813 RepID=UPI00048C9E70|nr:CsbD family protein [Thalassobacillus devorans]
MADKKGLSEKMKAGVSKTKGEFKDQVGNAKNDPKMQAEGKNEKDKGEFQKKTGKMKGKFNQ